MKKKTIETEPVDFYITRAIAYLKRRFRVRTVDISLAIQVAKLMQKEDRRNGWQFSVHEKPKNIHQCDHEWKQYSGYWAGSNPPIVCKKCNAYTYL